MRQELFEWQETTNDIWRCAPTGVVIFEGKECFPLDNDT